MQKKHAFILLLPALLSGCNIATIEHYKQTMAAIQTSETNIQSDISQLNDELVAQRELLTTLSKEISSLSSELATLNKQHLENNSTPKSPKIVYVEKPVPQDTLKDKTILGEQEWVWLDAVNQNFKARIDTGATTSSLNATDIQEFERDGKTWIKFNLKQAPKEGEEDKEAKLISIEAPLTRWVRIRQSSTNELDRRPVVSLRIRIGNLHEMAQFTLTDRSHA